MKAFLPILAALLALPLLSSCVAPTGYGVTYSTGSYGGYNSYGSSVGIISTSHSRWGYDPYYRSYYDYSLGKYYNLGSGRYYSTLPRRYSTPYYPSHYRRGTALRCPTNLPHLHTSYRRPSEGFVNTSHSRWAYDPYRRSYFDRQNNRYYDTSRGRYYDSLPQRHSKPSYPSGHRSGKPVQVHNRLPYVNHRTESNHSRRDRDDDRNRYQRPTRTQSPVFPNHRNQPGQQTRPDDRYRSQNRDFTREGSSSSRSYPRRSASEPTFHTRSSVNRNDYRKEAISRQQEEVRRRVIERSRPTPTVRPQANPSRERQMPARPSPTNRSQENRREQQARPSRENSNRNADNRSNRSSHDNRQRGRQIF
ncbi:hypothetical protein [Roseibacillus ishigakijimensis]|uniref:Uncharacterized protein n=1 Tax=Roseibacillus ishigakijimensis TaxID=454146 RepID=A0A934VHM6_9BACT|nr:hypothetical protein [Roseibacillus ishigakijimensis]MBK1834138.1 hypothetical protein [Roseibacillus ishigakijimensis]